MKQNEEQEWISDPKEIIQETLLQNFNRVKGEIESFIDELKKLKQIKENGFQNLTESSDPEKMILNLETLNQQLKINSAREKGIDMIVHDFGQQQKTKSSVSSCKDKSYEQDMKKLADLDSRLNAIESIVGKEEDKIYFLNPYSGFANLGENIKILSNQLNGLDLNSWDRLENRFNSLLHKLNQLFDKKNILENVEIKQKINELFYIVSKNEKKFSTVKEVASRLNLLSQIEEQAAQFKETLTFMETLQNQITSTINSNEATLKKLKEKFDTDLKVVKNSMNDIQKRINALK